MMKKMQNSRPYFLKYIKTLQGRAEVYHLIGKEHEAQIDLNKLLLKDIDLKSRINTLAQLSEISIKQGNIDKAHVYVDEIGALVDRQRDVFLRGRALIIKANVFRNIGDYKKALAMIKQSIKFYYNALAKKTVNSTSRTEINNGIAHAFHSLGVIYYGYGKYGAAQKYFSQSASRMKKLENRVGQIQSLNNMALIYWHKGDLKRAEKIFFQILKMASDMGHKGGIGYILQNLGLVVNDMGRLQDGLKKFEQAVKYANEIGDKGLMAINYNNIGITYERLCMFQPAFDNYQKGLDIFYEIGHLPGYAMANNNIAGIYYEWNKQAKALVFVDRAISIAKKGGYTDVLVRSYKNKGKMLLSAKRYKESASAIEQSFRLAEKHRMSGLMVDTASTYINSMVTGWYDKDIDAYANSDKYLKIIKSCITNATITGDEYILVLLFLTQYYSIYGSRKQAEEMYIKIRRGLRQNKNPYVLVETAMTEALILWRSNRPWRQKLSVAQRVAQGINSKVLLEHVKRLKKRLRHAPVE